MDAFDYVIIGGGSAGCVLANRLSADPHISVLLIEAGGEARSPFIHVPAAIIRLIGNPRFDWGFMVEPDSSRKGRSDYWPAGKVLGGSSSINGMLYVRGATADFDHWAKLGNSGWAASDVAPVFQRLERCTFPVEPLRGREGPLAISHLRSVHPLAAPFMAAAQAAGMDPNPDYNGATQEGIGAPQLTQLRGRRFSAADAWLAPARRRPNLKVLTGAQAIAIHLDGRRATGVTYHRAGKAIHVGARREVVLAAGALQSPKLLMLSGIGPAAALADHGITPILDQPHVGAHLMEHPSVQLACAVDQRTYNMEINSHRIGWHALNWLLRRRGPATSAYPHAVGFFRSDATQAIPDVQLMFGPFGFELTEAGVQPSRKPMVTAVVGLSYAHSEGHVRLRSADWRDKPVIGLEMLSDARDLAALTSAARFVRRILASAPFARHVHAELAPGPAVESDADWADYLRRTVDPTYHPVGTCRMSPNAADGVVDPQLRVHGVSGLRVVDASIFPAHVSGNTNGAVLMVAERAADLILGKA